MLDVALDRAVQHGRKGAGVAGSDHKPDRLAVHRTVAPDVRPHLAPVGAARPDRPRVAGVLLPEDGQAGTEHQTVDDVRRCQRGRGRGQGQGWGWGRGGGRGRGRARRAPRWDNELEVAEVVGTSDTSATERLRSLQAGVLDGHDARGKRGRQGGDADRGKVGLAGHHLSTTPTPRAWTSYVRACVSGRTRRRLDAARTDGPCARCAGSGRACRPTAAPRPAPGGWRSGRRRPGPTPLPPRTGPPLVHARGGTCMGRISKARAAERWVARGHTDRG